MFIDMTSSWIELLRGECNITNDRATISHGVKASTKQVYTVRPTNQDPPVGQHSQQLVAGQEWGRGCSSGMCDMLRD